MTKQFRKVDAASEFDARVSASERQLFTKRVMSRIIKN